MTHEVDFTQVQAVLPYESWLKSLKNAVLESGWGYKLEDLKLDPRHLYTVGYTVQDAYFIALEAYLRRENHEL